ncbi:MULTISPECIES: CoxG family protein [unclassified Sporosarcina]|uniref:CoxG family protein n=1 Tax=unclassified Sporosarcina TaxID=2647733 RepID=UPI000C16A506|nr:MULTISPECIES: SRPBCC domain-containing protein [unclassified Sporosarcina]PID04384.1 carbon monoxide dehydrogenase [Sporosarcina sp. P30]PID07562.1 carbon monoxide dehydrogenase [Sporosarcina sp. P31]PID10769.1 carbon monoxide dehydrogenase [Sporosarcina sp. P32b]
MPNGTKEINVTASTQHVWSFLEEVDQWAPLIPGYIEHEKVSENQFTWKFRADLGMMQKNIVMQVDITEKVERSMIAFTLEGLNESLEGNGSFQLEEAAETTILKGYLDIRGKGMMGSVINSMMKSYVPETVSALTEAIDLKISQIE